MPLWKLQRVGADKLDFLYEEVIVDSGIVLRPGVPECFRQQFTVVQALVHLTRWVERNDNYNATLQQIFDEARFLYDMDASLTVAEWSYETAERAGALVWVRKKGQTARLSGEWRQLFAT